MQVLMTILYILLFLVFLSILIIVHELGHLAMAKAFNVYCLEYSIGMGPLLFKHKRKNGETQFSIRGIPFGGYVSMYGEGVPLPDGVEIPESRSLNGVKWWKRAIIFLAGVTMNAFLAITFFFISNCMPQQDLTYINQIGVTESSIAYNAGLRSTDYIKMEDYEYDDIVSNSKRIYYLIDNQTYFNDDETVKYATCLNFEKLENYQHLDLAEYIFMYELKAVEKDGDTVYEPDFNKYVTPAFTSATIHVTKRVSNGGEKLVDGDTLAIKITQTDGAINSFGCSIYLKKWQNNFFEALGAAFKDFGNASIALFRAIGELIVKPASWQNVGGIIAVGYETTGVLQNFGFAKFLYVWGFISVNLAIFNLLPFPGLDGWQLLVLIVETVAHKKIPEKVKNIVSFIGLGLLLLLMGVIVIKDLITYVFVVTI